MVPKAVDSIADALGSVKDSGKKVDNGKVTIDYVEEAGSLSIEHYNEKLHATWYITQYGGIR